MKSHSKHTFLTQLPPSLDLDKVLMGHDYKEPSVLINEQNIENWWSVALGSNSQTFAGLMKRLTYKMTIGSKEKRRLISALEGHEVIDGHDGPIQDASNSVKERLMLEGVKVR